MQTIVIIRDIHSKPQPDQSVKLYLEFEFTKPGFISQVNITSQNAHFLNLCREMKGKEVMMCLEESEFNGRKFWRLSDPELSLVQLKPVMHNKPVAAVA